MLNYIQFNISSNKHIWTGVVIKGYFKATGCGIKKADHH